MKAKDQVLDVWGDLACFSQPAFKVERFSYPIITPSAARGIYDAIYCKPAQFRWQITGIDLLAPPKYIALRRNEVKEKVSVNVVSGWMNGKENLEPIWADGDRLFTGSDKSGRTQRQTMALRDVHYRLHAYIRPWPEFEGSLQGLEGQFRRRAARGQCIYQPYLGCREFVAFFALVEATTLPAKPIPIDMELGLMLYDVFDLSRPGASEDKCSISLFRASVCKGELKVPPYESGSVFKGLRQNDA